MNAPAPRGQFAHKLPEPQFSCGRCGSRFGTKAAKRSHKLHGCLHIEDVPNPEDGEQLAANISCETKARANAEWAAMDAYGRLPDGWEYEE